MELFKNIHKYLLLLLTGTLALSSIGAVIYYQSNKINNDGSITLEITYTAPNQEVKQKNNLIGTLPFTPELVREYFTFPGSEITKVAVYKDIKDTANRTGVTVELAVKDFSKISESKALKNVVVTWEETDTGAVYVWFLSPDDLQKSSIETYHFVLSSDPEIKSTNGQMNGKVVTWFVYGNKENKYGAYFVTTVKADGFEIGDISDNSNKSGDSKEKSCGLFGLELPFVILGGLVLTYRRVKK